MGEVTPYIEVTTTSRGILAMYHTLQCYISYTPHFAMLYQLYTTLCSGISVIHHTLQCYISYIPHFAVLYQLYTAVRLFDLYLKCGTYVHIYMPTKNWLFLDQGLSTVVLYMWIMRVWKFFPQNISPKPA